MDKILRYQPVWAPCEDLRGLVLAIPVGSLYTTLFLAFSVAKGIDINTLQT
jgi:hypothetical protein